jgi:hypothetical protein
MAFSQPYVLRVYFNNETDAVDAQDDLMQHKVRSDYIKTNSDEPGKFKLIFTDSNIHNAVKLVKKLTKGYQAGYFSPQNDWYGGFLPLETLEAT